MLREDERIAPEYIYNSMEFLIKYELGKNCNPKKRNKKIEIVKQMEAQNARCYTKDRS